MLCSCFDSAFGAKAQGSETNLKEKDACDDHRNDDDHERIDGVAAAVVVVAHDPDVKLDEECGLEEPGAAHSGDETAADADVQWG